MSINLIFKGVSEVTNVTKKCFGSLDGREVSAFVLSGSGGCTVTVSDYGCTVLSILAPDRTGKAGEVTLGYDTLEGYVNGEGYFGAAIGRVGNRIGGAAFDLNGKRYDLFKNDGDNHLHGGRIGFDKRVWNSEIIADGVRFIRVSPDGEEGYPGTLTVSITYRLTDKNELVIDYSAAADADTIVNLTNHSYFNLAGGGADSSSDVLSQELRILASHITSVGPDLIPTGELMDVAGTPFDFREFHAIGERIGGDHVQLKNGGGYDHNFALDSGREFALACEARCTETGRLMRVYTDQPGVQLYTGNMINCAEGAGRGGRTYKVHDAFCLETQVYPDAIHHENFPSALLRAGEELSTRTVYEFSLM